MLTTGREIVAGVLLAGLLASLAYSVACLVRLLTFCRSPAPPGTFTPKVTVLKPVCGSDPTLLGCLRSFFTQDYPDYQVVFGVRDPNDPALPVIRQVLAEFPERDATLIVDGRVYGGNRKMSNMTNVMPAVKHDILVIADADSLVEPRYLRAVVAPFQDPKVGAATVFYVGQGMGGFWSVLGASFINDWFLPSVLVGLLLEPPSYCFGATMAARREALEAIGGFRALTTYLADDYLLGHLIKKKDWEVRFAPTVVTTAVYERSLVTLLRHELRWGRTFRTVRPIGWTGTILTDTTILALLYVLASGGSALGLSLLAGSLLLRSAVVLAVRRRFPIVEPPRLWLVPFRDLLCFTVRLVSFVGRQVRWKSEDFLIQSAGHLEPKEGDAVSSS
jgi:ceramide glucosyltransferase